MIPLLWGVVALGCVCGVICVVVCVRNPIIEPAADVEDEMSGGDGEWCDCVDCVRVVSLLQARTRADATPDEIVRSDLLLWELEWSATR